MIWTHFGALGRVGGRHFENLLAYSRPKLCRKRDFGILMPLLCETTTFEGLAPPIGAGGIQSATRSAHGREGQ